MKLSQDRLPADLKKNFRQVYLVAGDEPLLVQEACDAIRHTAKQEGFLERRVLFVESSFDWRELPAEAQTQSLFGERRLIELRMPGKPGRNGLSAIEDFLAERDSDSAFLLVTGALDQSSRNARWVKAMDAAGALVQIWPVQAAQLPAWLAGRLKRHGLRADPDALAVLADRVEGNMLAAAQEIERIALLRKETDGGSLSVDDILDRVEDNARFSGFALMDAALAGRSLRVQRMLQGLRDEGMQVLALSGLLARELRQLLGSVLLLEQGKSMDVATGKTWPKKRPLLALALKRHRRPALERMHRSLLALDREVKGLAPGDPWLRLASILLELAGTRLSAAEGS